MSCTRTHGPVHPSYTLERLLIIRVFTLAISLISCASAGVPTDGSGADQQSCRQPRHEWAQQQESLYPHHRSQVSTHKEHTVLMLILELDIFRIHMILCNEQPSPLSFSCPCTSTWLITPSCRPLTLHWLLPYFLHFMLCPHDSSSFLKLNSIRYPVRLQGQEFERRNTVEWQITSYRFGRIRFVCVCVCVCSFSLIPMQRVLDVVVAVAVRMSACSLLTVHASLLTHLPPLHIIHATIYNTTNHTIA